MTAELVAVVLLVGFAAATQSITGFGYALIVVPGLTLLFGPKVAVVAMSSVGVPLVAWNAVRWRADIQRREAITKELPASLLKRYNSLREQRRGQALAIARDGFCQGCNMHLPPQLYNSLFKGEELLACPHCQRVLILKQQPVL